MTTTAPTTTSPAKPVERYAWQVLAISAASVFVVFLDATIVNIAFPAISRSFDNATPAGLSWVLNAYAVVFGALLVAAGSLGDYRGQRRTFLWGLGIFGVASFLCAVAPTLELLVAARAVQATGAALLVPTSLALLLPQFPPARRAAAVGIWGAVGALAAAAGPSLGALLVQGPGWRWVFYVNVPICAAALLVGRRVLRRVPPAADARRPDLLGALMVVGTFGLLSLAIVQGQPWGWTSFRVLAALAVAVILLPLVVRRSLHHPQPALPVLLFKERIFAFATVSTVLFAAAFYAQILANVLFISGVWHWSLLHTAVAVLPAPLIAAALAPVAGRLADRFGYLPVVVPGSLIYAAGSLWLALETKAEPSYLHGFVPAVVLTGIGIGAVFGNLGAAATSSLASQQLGIGSATNSMARQLGAVLGVAALIALLSSTSDPADPARAFHHAWLIISACAAGCAAAGFGLARRRTAPELDPGTSSATESAKTMVVEAR